MKPEVPDYRDSGFVTGLVTGTLIGAGLAVWLMPRLTAELRQRATEVVDRVTQASNRIGEAVDELTRKGQDVRDDVADAVAHGAHVVEQYATAARTDRAARIKKHSAL